MSRKKTALEAAQQRGRQGLDPKRAATSVGVGVLIALAIGCFAQAFAVWSENSTAAALDAARERVVASLGETVAKRQDELAKALADEEIRLSLAVVDDAARQRAMVRLKQLMPDVISSEYYSADLPELITADLSSFGYVRANILAEARASGGIARAQAQKDAQGLWLLGLAQAVREGDRTLAYAYVLLPAGALSEAVTAQDSGGGRLELRQGALAGSVIAARGGGGGLTSDERSFEVPRSIFTVVTASPERFKIGEFLPLLDSRSVGGLFGIGVLLLAGAGVLVHLRRRMPAAAGVSALPADELPVDNIKQRLARIAGGDEPAPAPVKVEPTMPSAPPPKPLPPKPAEPAAVGVDRSIFRAYDVRGVVGKTLTPEVARAVGQAIGTALQERGLKEIVVGRDGRASGPELAGALITGLRSTGCDVIDIGAVPTPVVYFATYHLNTGSGVMVTGSHNPPDFNGFKIVLGGETLAEQQIQDLYVRIAEGRIARGNGGLQVMDVGGEYIERITGDVQIDRKLKVVVDAGNGIAGPFAPKVLEGIGCEVEELYCDVDGTFPNHHPDPGDPANLRDLIMAVKQVGADLGLAFDGDGDRLGVVTANGEIIYPDRLLMLFAIDVLNRNPGAAVIYDVKCTGHLQEVILRHGGSPMMWKTGHSLIKAKMREEDAELAGEMSGHFFFRERWFGFDDGIYAAARLAEILGASDRKPQEMFDELPKGVSTPELKIPMEEGAHYAYIARFREKATFPGARTSTIDGVRADYPDGWGLTRASNTTPSLILRFDADSEAALKRIQDTFREQLLLIEPSLKLPF